MEKIENIRFRNLERLFEGKRAFAEVAAGTGEKR
jgi:hypothetical protein